MRLKKFELNTTGNDYVIGDVHGDWDNVDQALLDVKFDEDNDRLFCVGDLIDRGPNSASALLWLAKPWFHTVRGNHENMCIEVFNAKWSRDNYLLNGGAWFLDLQEAEQQLYVDAFSALPYAIEIQTENGRVGIVHAEVYNNDWETTGDEWELIKDVIETMLWARSKFKSQDSTPVANIDKVYVGHTPLKYPAQLGNVYYIDTGSVYPEGSLTIVKL